MERTMCMFFNNPWHIFTYITTDTFVSSGPIHDAILRHHEDMGDVPGRVWLWWYILLWGADWRTTVWSCHVRSVYHLPGAHGDHHHELAGELLLYMMIYLMCNIFKSSSSLGWVVEKKSNLCFKYSIIITNLISGGINFVLDMMLLSH